MNNKKPNKSIINEANGSEIFFKYIREHYAKKILIKEFDKKFKDEIVSKFSEYDAQQYKLSSKDEKEKFKHYHKYIYGHAKKNLKKYKYITLINNTKDDFEVFVPSPKFDKNMDSDNYNWDIENTVSNIYKFISTNKHAIPAFQRMTAWNTQKDYIELAYSIYNSIPLGLMYFWEINAKNAEKITHYKFKRDVNTKDEMHFEKVNINEFPKDNIASIIDGQQRITGINVLINGKLNDKVVCFSERQIGSRVFQFKNDSGDIFQWTKLSVIFNELRIINNMKVKGDAYKKQIVNLGKKLYISEQALNKIYKGFFKDKLLAVCNIKNSNKNQIINLFIRNNSFGKKLKPTDILLSSLVGKIDSKIRTNVELLVTELRKYKSNFVYASVLKLISIYFTENAKTDHEKFIEFNKKEGLPKVKDDNAWQILRKSVQKINTLLKNIEFTSSIINSDNSLLPIIIWHTKHGNNKNINNEVIKKNIKQYLLFAQLFGIFKSSTDQRLQEIIVNINNSENFSKNYDFDEKTSNINALKKQVDEYEYNKNNIEIKIILGLDKNVISNSDTIEHLIPQSNEDYSNKIWNLALLPHDLNSKIKNKSIMEKVKILAEEKSMTEIEIKKSLGISEYNPHKHGEERMKYIYNLISESIIKNYYFK